MRFYFNYIVLEIIALLGTNKNLQYFFPIQTDRFESIYYPS